MRSDAETGAEAKVHLYVVLTLIVGKVLTLSHLPAGGRSQ